MNRNETIEFWLRGPVDGIPAILQPVAHALLQAQCELHTIMTNVPNEILWLKPGGKASPGFHLQHIAGVLDRMSSYSRQQTLSEQQLEYLRREGHQEAHLNVEVILKIVDEAIEHFLILLKNTDPSTLNDFRGVGRKQLPSTKAGLLFHAAEHTMRHTGQLMVTVHWLTLSKSEP